MKGFDKNIIKKFLLAKGMVSEYLPCEFLETNFNEYMYQNAKANNMAPFMFSMSKFDKNNNRRIISIPEPGAYLDTVKKLLNGEILEKIICKNDDNSHSLSKILKNDEFRLFKQEYDEMEIENQKNDFIENLINKLEKTNGAKGILHLDIANFYGSFYTHNISAIINGAGWAQEEFDKKGCNGRKNDDIYKNLEKLDTAIRSMNIKRTHGLLLGPAINFLIAESILTIIDDELEKELKEFNVDFIRFIDDYDVIINNKQQIEKVKRIFTNVLQVYGFVLNDAKTRYEGFPYYQYSDYKSFTEACIKEKDIYKCYSYLAEIEKKEEQNGALYYLSNHLKEFLTVSNKNTVISIALDLLNNIPKAVDSSSKILIDLCAKKNSVIIDKLKLLFLNSINNQLDLEQIWILYTLLKCDEKYKISIDLLYKMNDLSIIMYLNERDLNQQEKNVIINIQQERSWMLQYEMYSKRYITMEDLHDRADDFSFYKILLENGYCIYKKGNF